MANIPTEKQLDQYLTLLRDETVNPSAIYEVAPNIADLIEELRIRNDNHRETLRGIAEMDPATEGDRMRLWARDALSGYVETAEASMKKQQDKINRLRDALVKAVAAVQTWHNMGMPGKQASELWDLYWRASPEMKPLREALEEPRG